MMIIESRGHSPGKKSRGKLGNDGKLNFVTQKKKLKWREKTYGPQDICKLQK